MRKHSSLFCTAVGNDKEKKNLQGVTTLCVMTFNIRTTQHNDTQQNSTQHNATHHNTTHHNATQHNATQHNATQHIATQHKKIQYKDNQHNNKKIRDIIMTLSIMAFYSNTECYYAECHNYVHYAERYYADCHYAKRRGAVLQNRRFK
jgi:hypothetical protein